MRYRIDTTPASFWQSILDTVKSNPVTTAFTLLNLLVFMFQQLVYGGNEAHVLYRMGAKFGPAIQDGDWYRLVMPIMLHGGWLHLAMNNLGLWMVGPIVERIYGSAYFAAIYLIAGIFGVVASYWNAPTLSVGASGALFGIVGATAVYFVLNRRLLRHEERRFFVTLLLLIVGNLAIGQFIPGIDQAAHVGGLVGGCLIALVSAPRHTLRIGPSLIGTPQAYIESSRPQPIRVLGALVLLLALSGAAAWWVSSTVEYGSETMRLYEIFKLLQ